MNGFRTRFHPLPFLTIKRYNSGPGAHGGPFVLMLIIGTMLGAGLAGLKKVYDTYYPTHTLTSTKDNTDKVNKPVPTPEQNNSHK